jgi:peptide/nickel transport system permease protein
MATAQIQETGPSSPAVRTAKQMGRFNRWDTPWLNTKLLLGVGIIALILIFGIFGRFFWDSRLALTGKSPLNLPPVGITTTLGGELTGTWAHPLGTESSGRDMLALIIVGAPNSFLIGIIAATVGMGLGIILGFTSGFVGGRTDDIIRLMSDVAITIPALLVLIVIQSLLRQVEIATIALLISLFAWPTPTRLIRAQVLTMRESGYVQLAKLSGASTFSIMFRIFVRQLHRQCHWCHSCGSRFGNTGAWPTAHPHTRRYDLLCHPRGCVVTQYVVVVGNTNPAVGNHVRRSAVD